MADPTQREGRPPATNGNPATNFSTAIKNESTVAAAADNLSHFQRRVVVEAMLDAWAPYWERRARALEASRPQPGEYQGRRASRADLSAQWQRLTDAAAACRRKALVSPLELVDTTVDDLLGEVS